jgi:5-methylcytosine-specific restriction endonuclease McrA
MRKIKDITGMVFYRLTAIERVGKNKNNRSLWKCKCICGNTVIKNMTVLQIGKAKSCGCLDKETRHTRNLKGWQESATNRLIRSYKRNAKLRNLEYILSREEFLFLTSGKCYYCDSEPSQICKSEYNSGDYVYNGIDRKNPKQGYLFENCVSCCYKCNRAKWDLTDDEFFDLVKRVYKFKLDS